MQMTERKKHGRSTIAMVLVFWAICVGGAIVAHHQGNTMALFLWIGWGITVQFFALDTLALLHVRKGAWHRSRAGERDEHLERSEHVDDRMVCARCGRGAWDSIHLQVDSVGYHHYTNSIR